MCVCDTHLMCVAPWAHVLLTQRWYVVTTISRLLKITGLFCKRDLQKRLYSVCDTHLMCVALWAHWAYVPLSVAHWAHAHVFSVSACAEVFCSLSAVPHTCTQWALWAHWAHTPMCVLLTERMHWGVVVVECTTTHMHSASTLSTLSACADVFCSLSALWGGYGQ